MTSHQYLPSLSYVCVFGEAPIEETRKGRKRITISNRYQFSGYVHIESTEYRVKFLTYDDINRLWAGQLTSKKSILSLYLNYTDAIDLQAGQYFSPVVWAPRGCVGEAGVITKEPMVWLPYLTITKMGDITMQIDMSAIECETGTIIPVTTLETKPGQLVFRKGLKPRWVWRDEKSKPDTDQSKTV